jgi:hypothetical protein
MSLSKKNSLNCLQISKNSEKYGDDQSHQFLENMPKMLENRNRKKNQK